MKSKSSARSGRRPIPLKWTRIISLDLHQLNEIKSYSVDEDLSSEYNLPAQLSKKKKSNWKAFFDPRVFWKSREVHEMEKYKLNDRELKAAGKRATDLRRLIRERAEALVDDD